MTILAPHHLKIRSAVSDTTQRNLWVFLQGTLLGYVGLDPEQQGNNYWLTQRDNFTIAVLPLLVGFFYFSGMWGLLLFLLSPQAVCWFAELSNDPRYPAPRVWLSRWYVTSLGMVLLWSGFPAWVRWPVVIVWALQSLYASQSYSSELAFYEQVKRENPNRDHYRIASLAFLYLREGRESQADDECQDVLRVDPQNPKIRWIVSAMQQNIRMHDAGILKLSFLCPVCRGADDLWIEDGTRMTETQHDMFFHRSCPACSQGRN